MKSKVPFFTRFYKSIISPKFYVTLNELSVSAAIKYLILISLLLGLIGYIRPTYFYYKFMNTIHNEVIYDFPNFTFNKGILNVEGKQPILMKKNDYYILIDTTGKTDLSKIEGYDKAILILRDKAYIKKSNASIDETRYSIIKFMEFNKEQFIEEIYDFKAGSFIILILGPLLFLISNLFTSFIVSTIGTLINSVLKAGIKYSSIYKLSIYSITTSTVISTIRRLTGINITLINYFYIAISAVYIFLAIRSILIEQGKNIEE